MKRFVLVNAIALAILQLLSLEMPTAITERLSPLVPYPTFQRLSKRTDSSADAS